MNFDEITASLDLDGEYQVSDISRELYREVVTSGGVRQRIDNPVALITRKGGSTHRIVNADNVVYCYASPETGQSVVTWFCGETAQPVQL